MRHDELIEESGFTVRDFDQAFDQAKENVILYRAKVQELSHAVGQNPTNESIVEAHMAIHILWMHQGFVKAEGVCSKASQGFSSCILPAYHEQACKGPLVY